MTIKSKSMNSSKRESDDENKPAIKIMKLNTYPEEELDFLQQATTVK